MDFPDASIKILDFDCCLSVACIVGWLVGWMNDWLVGWFVSSLIVVSKLVS